MTPHQEEYMDTKQKKRTPPKKQVGRSAKKAKAVSRSATRQTPRPQPAARREQGVEGMQSRASSEEREKLRRERERRAKQNREAEKARLRRRERAQRRNRQAKRPMPALVYTQPAAFNRSKLVMELLIVTAVVLAVVVGLSIFFKVEKITVSGANAYSEWVIREASGIQEGDNLMTINRPRASGRIVAELPYVKSVRIGIKLPDTVNIIIEEVNVVYAISSTDGLWWLITSEGKVAEQTDGGTAANYTKILGVELESPLLGEMATAFEIPTTEPTQETDAQGNPIGTIPVVVSNEERLSVALEILRALEANDIVGEAANVDVSDLSEIELWYGEQYQVKLGDTSEIERKIASMYAAINSEKLKNGYGVLDVSFTIWADKVMYTPFT